MRTTVSAERLLDAPPDVIYHCIADYREHHRPDGFLPPAFSDLQISHGGVGAGTEVSWVMDLGGRRRTIAATISEPDPGHILVETAAGLVTTFTVEPVGRRARVRFETVIDAAGLEGLTTRLFAARLIRPIYEDEMGRLEGYARALADRRTRVGPGSAPAAAGHGVVRDALGTL